MIVPRDRAPGWKRVAGWCVHAYTATGLLVAAGIAAVLLQPTRGPDDYRLCFLLMLVATVIDATDGTLARAIRIKEVLPGFDGRRLDDLVDFLLYTCLPLLLIDRAGLLPDGWRWVLLLALLASAYGFCQTDVKSADGSFVGFPSYWNIVAFYLYALPVSGGWAVVAVAGLAVLTFVPSRYPYPTQRGRVNRMMLGLGSVWAALLLLILLSDWGGGPPWGLVWVSASYPAIYMGTAWGMSVVRRRGAWREAWQPE
ncbi:MAG TPA: CDP-alcohol phosphatidyltransferase [Gemmataceae bacterium]|jgi:phosphatidylcholine synthase|nr:CDP-alcohol phosphatidyltransferase [Gemmataceae bacterium]